MASAFCLDREGSLGCSWSEDILRWAFCHLSMMGGGRQSITHVLATQGVTASLRGAKSWAATFQFPYAENCNADENGTFLSSSTVIWEKRMLGGNISAVCPWRGTMAPGSITAVVALSCSAAKERIIGLSGRCWLFILERFSFLLFARDSYPTGVVQLLRAFLKHTVNLLLSCVFQT